MHHKSLYANPLIPKQLNPQEKMERNSPCWCLSGKKWKKCHLNRDKEVPVAPHVIFEITKVIREEATSCLHPRAPYGCGTHVIASHTVQRRVGLKAIESNGHVMTGMNGIASYFKNDGRPKMGLHGVRTASTFPGFCNKHDSELFRPVEVGSWIDCKENAFLLSFRAVSYEKFAKLCLLKTVEWNRENIDKGDNFVRQVQEQTT